MSTVTKYEYVKVVPIEQLAEMVDDVYSSVDKDELAGKEYIDKVHEMAGRYRGRLWLGPEVPLSALPSIEKHMENLDDQVVLLCLNGKIFAPQVLADIAHVFDGGFFFQEQKGENQASDADNVYLTVPKANIDKVVSILETYIGQAETAAAYIVVNIGESKVSFYGTRGTDLVELVESIRKVAEEGSKGKHIFVLALPAGHPAVEDLRTMLTKMQNAGDLTFTESSASSDILNHPIRHYFLVLVDSRYRDEAASLFSVIMNQINQWEEEE